MSEAIWLVDYENVQKIDPARVPANARLKVFIGSKQNKLPTELVKLREALGERFEWIWIDGTASNALDFHIACHLGEGLARAPQAEFVILSNDKGFDPLLRHLKSRGIKCKRDGKDKQAKPAAKTVPNANAQRVFEHLRKIGKDMWPAKRTKLNNLLTNHFRKTMSAEQVAKAIDQLFKTRLIAGMDAALVYQF